MISIIGAGPAGAVAARDLAHDFDVAIYEEHKEVGSPVACTGILTDSLDGHLKIKDECVINRIKKFRVFGDKENASFTVRGENIILDRKKFDQHLIQEAVDNGAKLFTGHRLERVLLRQSNIGLKFGNGVTGATDILVGADGPTSVVAKQSGLFGGREFLVGMQCLVGGRFDKSVIEVYMTKSPGMFAWVVPENESIARVGVATDSKTKDFLNDFLMFLEAKDYRYCSGSDQSGVIPKYHPNVKTSLDKRVFLLGDAATQTKNTTAGGIIPGIICARTLADCIKNNKDYQKEWKKVLGKDLYYHYLIRKSLDTFSNKDHDDLIRILKSGRSKKLIEEFDREFPSRFVKRLLLFNPSLLKFSKNLRL